MSDDLDRGLAAARRWRAEGHGVAVATVIETWGSAPRRPGSHLFVRDDGLFEGSVSGGCVEGDVIANAAEVIADKGFVCLDYGVADGKAWDVGLPCGGKIAVLVQALDDAAFPPALLDSIAEAREQGRALTLSTDLATGRTDEGEAEGAYINRYQPPLRMVIVGAVHITQALVPMARLVGFDVSVIDPRPGFAAAARFDLPVDDRFPDEAMDAAPFTAATAVVTLSHDPKLDDPALIAALRSPAYYIAALGSRRSHAARLDRLREAGFGEGDLQRIHGPAGLSIGAATPAEIAVSVLAQAIAIWRGKP